MTRKLCICAIVTAFTSCLAYLVGAWVIIYGLKPEHPEFAPQRLFHEALSHLPVVILLLTIFGLIAFACAANRVVRVPSGYVISISAEVSGIVALIHGLLSDSSAFDSTWWWLIVGSAPIVIVVTVLLIYFRTRDVHSVAV